MQPKATHTQRAGVKSILFAICILTVSVTAKARQETEASTIQIVGLKIPWLLDTEHPGPYNDLMDELFTGFELPLEVSILPARRARRQFFVGSVTCYYPGSLDSIAPENRAQLKGELIVSKPFNRSKLHALTPADAPPISSLEELANKTVAVDLSLAEAGALLPASAKIISANDVAQSFALVTQGRANAAMMVAYDYQLFAARTPNMIPMHFDKSLYFSTVEDRLMCKKSSDSETLIAFVDDRIESLNKSGTLAQVLVPDYVRSKRQFAERPRPYLVRFGPTTSAPEAPLPPPERQPEQHPSPIIQ